MVIEKEGKRISWVDEAVGLKTSFNICFAFYKIQKFLDCRGIWTVYSHLCSRNVSLPEPTKANGWSKYAVLINYQSDFLLSRNFQISIIKIPPHHVAFLASALIYCLFSANFLEEESVVTVSNCFLPIHPSASICFWLRSLMAKATQLPLACFQSVIGHDEPSLLL